MPDIDLDRLLQIITTFPSLFAAIAAAFAYFSSRRNNHLVRETKVHVERVELLINGHTTKRIEVERKAARAEGVVDALQAIADAEKTLLKGDKETD